jgi:trans-2,3-dihydro-3-hydroxyanthranilate isomerase
MMPVYEYFTVDVFTRRRFGGNQLAVFPDAAGIDDATMQALAAELNYSETTFVLPPEDRSNTAKVRIFNRKHEMPFAGHPNVGTAFVLAQLGRAGGDTLRFEEISGRVDVELIREAGAVVGAKIDAPQPLQTRDALPTAGIAACLSLAETDLVLTEHPPVPAGVGIIFVLVAVSSTALAAAAPDLTAYQKLVATRPDLGGRLSIFLYAQAGPDIRARMFAPLAGTWEDPATGSANVALAALKLSISGAETLHYKAIQGVEMGRESHLDLQAWRAADGIRASVGGRCVSVFRGAIEL